MIMEVKDFKSQIRAVMISRFIKSIKSSIIIKKSEFIEFAEDLYGKDETTCKLIMASLIADCYEMLKWLDTIGEVKNDVEKGLLEDLEASEDFNDSVAAFRDEFNIVMGLKEIFCYHTMPISGKISAKNNLHQSKINSHILDDDKLHYFGEHCFLENNVIFSEHYQKEEYLHLYEFLYTECFGNSYAVISNYVNMVMGLSYYNTSNFHKLLLDMCQEFYLQKAILHDRDYQDFNEDYLLYLIRRAPTDQIIDIVTEKDELLSYLAIAYMNHDYYDSPSASDDHQQMSSRSQKVLTKLERGKKKEDLN